MSWNNPSVNDPHREERRLMFWLQRSLQGLQILWLTFLLLAQKSKTVNLLLCVQLDHKLDTA